MKLNDLVIVSFFYLLEFFVLYNVVDELFIDEIYGNYLWFWGIEFFYYNGGEDLDVNFFDKLVKLFELKRLMFMLYLICDLNLEVFCDLLKLE